MKINLRLSSTEERILYSSKVKKFGEDGAAGVQIGYELARLIKAAKLEDLKNNIDIAEEWSLGWIKEPVCWRISAEAMETLNQLAAQLNSSKSSVIRAIIYCRWLEIKQSKDK